MSVVYDGPLPPSKSKKAPPPFRSSTMPASRSPAPLTSQASGQSVPNFAAYDGPLPAGTSPARGAAPSERPTRLRTTQSARSSDYGEPQTDPPASVSNGSGLPYDGPLPSKALNRKISRSASKRAPPLRPGTGRQTIPEDGPELPPTLLLQTFIPSLNAYVKAKIGKTGEVGYNSIVLKITHTSAGG